MAPNNYLTMARSQRFDVGVIGKPTGVQTGAANGWTEFAPYCSRSVRDAGRTP
jgi:hypothetical protein